uniref:Secreted protein n=1 Tax=Gongylonema pulchrum TaxID=637853 RepID=A0A183EIA9_9BILA
LPCRLFFCKQQKFVSVCVVMPLIRQPKGGGGITAAATTASKSAESCKCYCQGGKRISYPYGWTAATARHDSSDELSSHPESRPSTTRSNSRIEQVSYQSAHPAAAKQLESSTLERKPSLFP